jgi:hypothetical protein
MLPESVVEHVRAHHIEAYLKRHDWKRDRGFARIIYVAPVQDDSGQPIHFIVPSDTDQNEVVRAADRLVGLASVLEGRPESLVAAELLPAVIDTLDVRIKVPNRIHLQAAPEVHEALGSLFLYGVVAEYHRHPIGYVYRVPSNIRPLDGFWLKPSEKRSFSFRVEVEWANQLVLRHTGPSKDPLERRVLYRILRGLRRCQAAADNHGWADPESEYIDGLNAHMCDALLLLHNAVGGADIEFGADFSAAYGVPEDIERKPIAYTTRAAQMAHKLGNAYRRVSEPTQAHYTGVIVGLTNRVTTRQRREQLRLRRLGPVEYTFDADRCLYMRLSGRREPPLAIHFSLGEADYERACDAHKSGAPVRVRGEVNKQGQRWIMDPVTWFDVDYTNTDDAVE